MCPKILLRSFLSTSQFCTTTKKCWWYSSLCPTTHKYFWDPSSSVQSCVQPHRNISEIFPLQFRAVSNHTETFLRSFLFTLELCPTTQVFLRSSPLTSEYFRELPSWLQSCVQPHINTSEIFPHHFHRAVSNHTEILLRFFLFTFTELCPTTQKYFWDLSPSFHNYVQSHQNTLLQPFLSTSVKIYNNTKTLALFPLHFTTMYKHTETLRSSSRFPCVCVCVSVPVCVYMSVCIMHDGGGITHDVCAWTCACVLSYTLCFIFVFLE